MALGSRNASVPYLAYSRPILLFCCSRRVTYCQITFRERRNAIEERGVTHCLREWRAFPNLSTRSSPGSVVWSLQLSPGAGTENLYHTELDQFPLCRAACGARDHWRRGPYPNTCDGTYWRQCLVPRYPE